MGRSEPLSFKNLQLLDNGTITIAFDHELKRVMEDIKDRPTDDRARVVQINCKLTPIVDLKNGAVNAEEADFEVEITSTVPKRCTKPYKMTAKVSGELYFHPDLPDDPEGSTMFDADGHRRDHGDDK